MNQPHPRAALLLVGALTAVWVAILFVRTPVPGEDGVSYLWMAQQFAAGRWHDALNPVFPPGYPLLLAPWLWCGADPERAACAVSTTCLLLTLPPLWRIAERLQPGAGFAAVVLFVGSPLLGRLAAEVYSEPAFLWLMALGTWQGMQQRWWVLGTIAGAAFWIRPEGLLLVPAMVLVAGGPRRALAATARAAVPALLFVLALGALRQLAGHGWDALPIHGFHEQRDDLPGRGAFLTNLLAVPGPWLEALGLAGLLCWCTRWRAPGHALLTAIVLQLAVVCTFVVRRRFFVSCGVAVVALAAACLQRLPRRVGAVLLTLAMLHGLFAGWNGGIDADRVVERQLGEYLRQQLRVGDTITGDLTRVLWFAGLPPLPPRHFDDGQLAAMVQVAEVRFVVLGERDPNRRGPQLNAALSAGFVPLPLDPDLYAGCVARGVVVFARR